MAHAEGFHVEVVYSSEERQVESVSLELGEGATVLHALRESRLLERHTDIDLAEVLVAAALQGRQHHRLQHGARCRIASRDHARDPSWR